MAKTTEKTNGKLADGTISILVVGGEFDGETILMDATVVKLASEEMERKHKLKPSNGVIKPTAEFAVDLDKSLKAMGYSSTPTIAVHAWVKACEYFAEVQKKTRRRRS